MREDQRWAILSYSLFQLLEEHNIAHMCLLAWPFMPSVSQVMAAYVGAVLGRSPRV
jgi:hypothetical protein